MNACWNTPLFPETLLGAAVTLPGAHVPMRAVNYVHSRVRTGGSRGASHSKKMLLGAKFRPANPFSSTALHKPGNRRQLFVWSTNVGLLVRRFRGWLGGACDGSLGVQRTEPAHLFLT